MTWCPESRGKSHGTAKDSNHGNQALDHHPQSLFLLWLEGYLSAVAPLDHLVAEGQSYCSVDKRDPIHLRLALTGRQSPVEGEGLTVQQKMEVGSI